MDTSQKTAEHNNSSTKNISGGNLVKKFDALTSIWREETACFSSITKIIKHPAYQEIINIGAEAVPLILNDLEKEPDHWFYALYKITGTNPVSPDSNFEQAAQEWLQWGKDKGLI
ncbi:hypothetical protein Pse7367_1254 [Thalassoporum mexicanum PCC 7367]|nr:hypothetical protein Pse7367_1254 [Pseudanabaena sp. PCC 7367]